MKYTRNGEEFIETIAKAVKIVIPGLREITPIDVSALRAAWPLEIKQFEVNGQPKLSVKFRWSDTNLTHFVQHSLFASMTVICSLPTGFILSDTEWEWLKGQYDETECLFRLTLESAEDETYSDMEFGGSCIDVFQVKQDWREIGFVHDPETKYLALETDQQGFKTTTEWTEEEYQDFVNTWEEEHAEEEEKSYYDGRSYLRHIEGN